MVSVEGRQEAHQRRQDEQDGAEFAGRAGSLDVEDEEQHDCADEQPDRQDVRREYVIADNGGNKEGLQEEQLVVDFQILLLVLIVLPIVLVLALAVYAVVLVILVLTVHFLLFLVVFFVETIDQIIVGLFGVGLVL